MEDIKIRDAVMEDIPALTEFFDAQLGNDWFMFKGKWQRAISGIDSKGFWHRPHKVLLALDEKSSEIIGLAILSHTGKLFNLVVHKDYRGKGIGKELLQTANPKYIRCKTDMSTGNPVGFYEKLGYVHVGNYDLWGNEALVGKKKNIAWMQRNA